jgi:serine/threonine protein kinase
MAAKDMADDPGRSLAGRQIGTYQILSLLGAGGMGEVYRALDTKLNRPVAIKFLSEGLADTTARRRFQREAQLASSLNHPHRQASDPQAIALVYFALGDNDRGFQWLTRAFDERQLFVSFVKFDPAFDNVRSDPRFEALVARLRLPD